MSSSAVSTRGGTPRTLPKLPISPEKGNEIIGFVLAALAALLLGSLLSYDPRDPSWLHHTLAQEGERTRNFIGPFGAQLSAIIFGLIGIVSLAVPALLGIEAWRRLTRRARTAVPGRSFGTGAILFIAPALAQLLLAKIPWQSSTIDAGGALGVVISEFLASKLNTGGAFVVLLTILLVAGSLVARSTLGDLLARWRELGGGSWQKVELLWAQRAKRRRERRRPGHATHAASSGVRVVRTVGAGGSIEPLPSQTPAPAPTKASRVGLDSVAVSADRPTGDSGIRPAASQSPRLDLPLRVKERKGEGHFSVRKVVGEDPTRSIEPASPEIMRGAPTAPIEAMSPAAATPSAALPPAVAPSPPGIPAAPTPANPLPTSPLAAPTAPRTSSPPRAPAAQPNPAVPQAPAPTPLPGVLPKAASATAELIAPPEQSSLEEQPDMPELPPVNLLDTDRPELHHDQAEQVRRGDVIQEACQHFGVDGQIAGISPGPVITVFEFQPAPGVKVSKVVNLQDDLALALKADSVRIDRIPGRSTLGLEVPNDHRSVIHLGQLLNEPAFTKARSVLTMAMGVDIHGEPIYFDLARMPHLLVAGATGAGKSVGLQSMITSILYKARKDEVKFIFIDPKRVELGVYSQIPHLKTEVVVEPKKAANALRWAVAEMERRYRLLAEIHVRSIDIFNRVVGDPKERQRLSLSDKSDSDFTDDDLKPLPYYVIIIDELADLMLVAASEVETSIARLAQMARAVGIHLIIATQRPSVDVLTGTIKANFPCRLAFATATRHDSRTILDQVGSEKLLGRGDALFMPPGTSRIMRLHGAYISEQETAALVRWLRRRGEPDLDMDVVNAPEEDAAAGGGGNDGAQDALFDDAARLVVRERQASASFLQRRMRVGFSRAARLIDMLEADGLLGPAQGSKPRDVLVPPDYFEEIDHHHDQE